jgi:hypothetical protein
MEIFRINISNTSGKKRCYVFFKGMVAPKLIYKYKDFDINTATMSVLADLVANIDEWEVVEEESKFGALSHGKI